MGEDKLKGLTRRDFLNALSWTALSGTSLAGTVACHQGLTASENNPPVPAAKPVQSPVVISQMPTRSLGQTGHQVKLFSLGGQSLLEQPGQDEAAISIINRALDLGVNYIDTARIYGDGVSETYIGQVMKTRRREVYLASKTRSRDYDGAMRDLEQSLTQLQTDHLDCWQLHNVRTDRDLKQLFGDEGAVKALEKARDQKMVRFVGITGHYDPLVLRQAIERYPFDSLLVALNAADRHDKSFIDNLLPVAVKKQIAIIGMKIPARGKIFHSGGITTMKQAMGYTLSLPVNTVIIGISKMSELEDNIQLAREFKPLAESEMVALENLTKNYYQQASYFKGWKKGADT